MCESQPTRESREVEREARRIAQFRFSIDLFHSNHEELSVFLDYLSAPEVALSFSHTQERWLLHEGMMEVSRLLHNFVASALSLIDHTRVLYRHLYESQGLIPGYPGQIEHRFESDPLSQFVIKLRQMTQHYRLPSVQMSTTLKGPRAGGGAQIELRLRVDDLEEYSGWNVPAKRFLADAGDHIAIRGVIEAYFEHVGDFNEWFLGSQREIHGGLPEAYLRALVHGVEGGTRKEVLELRERVADLASCPPDSITFTQLEEAFSPVLTVLDQGRLRLCRYDGRVWLRRATEMAGRRFTLPEDLTAAIMGLLSVSDHTGGPDMA